MVEIMGWQAISCYLIIGVNWEDSKALIGYGIGTSVLATYYMTIFNEIKSRGIKQILIVASNNLPGISEAIKAIAPQTIMHKCFVHHIRNVVQFVNDQDFKEFTSDMKQSYQAVSITSAKHALEQFDHKWSSKDADAMLSWSKSISERPSCFDFPIAIRKMIYTTKLIENVNGQMRSITKTKGNFTSVKSLAKIIFLKLISIEPKWRVLISNWGQVLNQCDVVFDLSKNYILLTKIQSIKKKWN